MEIEPIALIISMVLGTIVGLGYFAGLWITVQALPDAKHPVLVWAGSALLRVGGATVVFVILLRWGQAQGDGFDAFAPALAGLAGFIIARFGSTAIWGPTREPKIPTGDDAPPREQTEHAIEQEADE